MQKKITINECQEKLKANHNFKLQKNQYGKIDSQQERFAYFNYNPQERKLYYFSPHEFAAFKKNPQAYLQLDQASFMPTLKKMISDLEVYQGIQPQIQENRKRAQKVYQALEKLKLSQAQLQKDQNCQEMLKHLKKEAQVAIKEFQQMEALLEALDLHLVQKMKEQEKLYQQKLPHDLRLFNYHAYYSYAYLLLGSINNHFMLDYKRLFTAFEDLIKEKTG